MNRKGSLVNKDMRLIKKISMFYSRDFYTAKSCEKDLIDLDF